MNTILDMTFGEIYEQLAAQARLLKRKVVRTVIGTSLGVAIWFLRINVDGDK